MKNSYSLLKIVFLVVFLLMQTYSFSQKNDLDFSDLKYEKSKLKVGLENCNFVWNNEFFSPIVNGYTLIGYFLKPTLDYQISPNITLKGGVHLLKYSGIDNFSKIQPIYAITYNKNDFSFTMGTIDNALNHRLSNVLFLSERYFTNNLENGMQVFWKTDKIFLDMWLDWRKFIFKNDNEKERLTFGISSKIKYKDSGKWRLSFPMALLIDHKGGQIDVSDEGVKTIINSSGGVKFDYLLKTKWITKIEIKNQLFGFYDNSPETKSLFQKGYGNLFEVSLFKNKNYLKFGSWNANKYISLLGHPVYQCFSVNGTHATKRNLLTTQLYLNYTILKNAEIAFTAETFYDFINSTFDYTTGLTFTLKY